MYDIEIEREVCRLPRAARDIVRGFDNNWREQVVPFIRQGRMGLLELVDRAFEYHEILLDSAARVQARRVIALIDKKYSSRAPS